ncbi:hypothetical protein [Ferviditalea candida]|uniref:Uncharacterized protein n=1 Tax=Ferviditalea candida TaxID=3108399 RepID=A0ABU5ZGC0_9BACL|nr:hypothetical protein [Paenibacillaceae bacterium T2]
MKNAISLISVISVFLTVCFPVYGQPSLSQLIIQVRPETSLEALVRHSTIIAYGKLGSPIREVSTNTKIDRYKLVNYIQPLDVLKMIKGQPHRRIEVLSTGLDPLPLPTNPLNDKYPGALADGEYICFLKAVPGTRFMQIVGGWQGVYPMLDGKTIALDQGFPELNDLTISQFQKNINRLMSIRVTYDQVGNEPDWAQDQHHKRP